jgi:hypothetical protein
MRRGTRRPPTALGDTELFKLYSDNESFKKWLSESNFALTYEEPAKALVVASTGPIDDDAKT